MNTLKKMGLTALSGLALFAISCNTTSNSSDEIVSEEIAVNATLTLLDSLIKADPKNPDLYYDRALFYHNEGVDPKAMADMYSALHIDSANVSYYLLAGEIFLDIGEGEKAIALMRKGISLNPENEDLYIKAIEYNFYMLQHEAALNFANDLIQLNKYNADAYFLKGIIYKDIKQVNNAISALQTCIEVDPEFYNAHMQLGLLYSDNKDPLAIQYLENAISLDPGSREAYYATAFHYQRVEEYNTAISKYREMINLNPKDHEVFFNIGHCYIAVDSLDKAFKNFDIATQIQPQYAGAYYMKGYVKEMQGMSQEALAHYQQALKMLPEDQRILDAIARLQ